MHKGLCDSYLVRIYKLSAIVITTACIAILGSLSFYFLTTRLIFFLTKDVAVNIQDLNNEIYKIVPINAQNDSTYEKSFQLSQIKEKNNMDQSPVRTLQDQDKEVYNNSPLKSEGPNSSVKGIYNPYNTNIN